MLSLLLCKDFFLTQLSSSRDTAMYSEFVFYEFPQILQVIKLALCLCFCHNNPFSGQKHEEILCTNWEFSRYREQVPFKLFNIKLK